MSKGRTAWAEGLPRRLQPLCRATRRFPPSQSAAAVRVARTSRPQRASRREGRPPGSGLGRTASVSGMAAWEETVPGVLRLPSGRLVRGRGLRRGATSGDDPEFGLYLQSKEPSPSDWSWRWLRWPDFRLPVDRADARDALVELWQRAESERVEVACSGGLGRTGTALACLAVLDGVPSADAVAYVTERYNRRAVETPWQRWYVRRFRGPDLMTGKQR